LHGETEDLNQSLDRVLQIAKRRRWWIVVSFCVVTVGAIAASYLVPAQYKSDATILVQQQKVSDKYVTPTTSSDLMQELQAITQQVLSRSQLLQMIKDLDLYPRDKNRLGPDELVDLMRKDILIEPLTTSDRRDRDADAFKISYTGGKPDTAREVVNRLTNLVIVENLRRGTDDAKNTTTFLQEQLSTAQTDLRQQEQRLRDFKMEHLGELPSEQAGNLQVLQGLQMQMQNVQGALGRAREQQVYWESLLAQSHSLNPKGAADPNQTGPSRIAAVERQLTDLRTQRVALLAHYTPEHPDVLNINRQISETEALLEGLKSNQKNPAPTTDAALQITPEDDPAVAQLKSQLKANKLEIADYTAEEKRLEAQTADYRHRLNLTPVREQQLADYMRDYNLSQQHYADLEGKKTQSELYARMQQSQQGRQFTIVDPANYPNRPSSPDRRKIGIMGVAAGLGLGCFLALMLEMKDTSFHTEKEVSGLFDLPFVFEVPMLLSPTEEKHRKRTRALDWLGCSVLLTTAVAAELLVFWRG